MFFMFIFKNVDLSLCEALPASRETLWQSLGAAGEGGSGRAPASGPALPLAVCVLPCLWIRFGHLGGLLLNHGFPLGQVYFKLLFGWSLGIYKNSRC